MVAPPIGQVSTNAPVIRSLHKKFQLNRLRDRGWRPLQTSDRQHVKALIKKITIRFLFFKNQTSTSAKTNYLKKEFFWNFIKL